MAHALPSLSLASADPSASERLYPSGADKDRSVRRESCLSSDRHDDALILDLFPSGHERAVTATAWITTSDGALVGPEFKIPLSPDTTPARLSGKVPEVEPWSHKSSSLHRPPHRLR